MLSYQKFLQCLLEAIEAMPGKAGYVDYKKIDGHDVHVRYHRSPISKSTYRPSVTVNGSFHKEADHPPETNARIAGFVKSSMKSFMKDKKPGKVKVRANSARKKAVYDAFAKSKNVSGAGYAAKETKRGVTLANPANKATHEPIPSVPYDRTNPAHEPPRGKKKAGKGSFKGDLYGGKWKKKAKQDKFRLKGALWAKKGEVAGTGSW